MSWATNSRKEDEKGDRIIVKLNHLSTAGDRASGTDLDLTRGASTTPGGYHFEPAVALCTSGLCLPPFC